MNNMVADEARASQYPDRVYRNVGPQEESAGGRVYPAISRALVEAIAGGKPAWASFEHTDVAEHYTDDIGKVLTAWQDSDAVESNVDIMQEVVHDVATGALVSASQPVIQVWGGDPAVYLDPAAARRLGVDSLIAASKLEAILDGTSSPDLRRLHDSIDGEPLSTRRAEVGDDYVCFVDEGGDPFAPAPVYLSIKTREELTLDEARSLIMRLGNLVAVAERLQTEEAGK